MYPSGELERLETRKAVLQARIAVHRWECVAAAKRLARPLGMVDRGITMWRKISPFVKILGIPAGIFAAKSAFKRTRGKSTVSRAMTLLPLVMRGAKLIMQARAHRHHAAAHAR